MSYGSAYEAVADLHDKEAGWEEHVHVGSKESLNLATEALGRHGDSSETGLRIRDFETGETETYTFAELDAAANRVANYLVEHTDRGARVGAKLPTQFELYAVVFGTIKAGRIYLPLAPVFGPDALNYRLEDSRTSVLFTTEHGCETVDADLPALERIVTVDGGSVDGSATVDDYDAVRSCDDSFEAVETHPNDPFTLTYTSGTTGSPKGVLSPHRGPVELYAFTEYVVDLRPDDVYLVAASPSWSYGLNMGTIMSGIRGTAIGCYRGQFNPHTFFETLEEWDVDNAMIPPTALRQSRAAGIDLGEYDIDLRVLISAGEALDQDTVDWCEGGLGAPPQDSYGLTEGGMVVCNYAFDDWEVKPGSMGKVLPGAEVALLDEDGNEVEQGEVGEIAIKRDEAPTGSYWGRPEQSLETFTGLWLRTGDLARRDEDGYFWYVSRADNVIISSGYRIGPEEVEETLLNHPAVEEAAVVGKDDDTRGEIVAAYVTLVGEHEPSPELEDELSNFAREELSKHEYPREIAFIDELPKTASGKIKRAELAD
ncbi:acyl-CoA synthetase [Natronolimnohabitans innermongolicus]|uniref:AMP-dependent synthetase and ligase n=1 Tax=Natronolimnohabitans innermongolicus JCM 12255 TaxID=1227499 RepID=L9WM00_9EURY|nr:AMP-binding protein [Natronolimnohabitans innermongolicus]ELY50412.1 AMP-dependent synthetase and ligase [Natronolimnohabitans innermongolicus JCM 12255]